MLKQEQAAAVPAGEDKPKPKVKYSMSPGLAGFLKAQGVAIAATSYQSGRLYLVSPNPKGGLMVNEQHFRKAMGLYVRGKSLFLAALGHVIRLENVLGPQEWINKQFKSCYVARESILTGAVDAHDIGVTADGTVLFVCTRYNCLAATSKVHSFRPHWRPPFISQLVAEDRCHLNGLAMDEGRPRYVTAVSRSDTIDGWRDRRADGGIIIDVDTGAIVCEGLSMPHSPRVYRGKVWVLNSGTGELGWADTGSGRFEPLAFCPGFVRGLAFHGDFAFVGLSRPRYERFEGLALDARLKAADSEPWTGIQVINLHSGQCVQWFRIDGPVAEMYDVAILPGAGCAKAIGPASKEGLGLVTLEKRETGA